MLQHTRLQSLCAASGRRRAATTRCSCFRPVPEELEGRRLLASGFLHTLGAHGPTGIVIVPSSDIDSIERLKGDVAYNNHLTGKPVPTPILPAVKKLAQAYFQQTGKALDITSGYRSPSAQASAMYTKLNAKNGATNVQRTYRNQSLLRPIIQAFQSNTTQASRIAAMTSVIQNQVNSGQYISYHLINKAVDISVHGMTAKDKGYLSGDAATVGGQIVPEKGGPPHIHIQFPQVLPTPIPTNSPSSSAPPTSSYTESPATTQSPQAPQFPFLGTWSGPISGTFVVPTRGWPVASFSGTVSINLAADNNPLYTNLNGPTTLYDVGVSSGTITLSYSNQTVVLPLSGNPNIANRNDTNYEEFDGTAVGLGLSGTLNVNYNGSIYTDTIGVQGEWGPNSSGGLQNQSITAVVGISIFNSSYIINTGTIDNIFYNGQVSTEDGISVTLTN